MATISTLAVSLIARTSAFERGMKRSRSSLSRFQQTTVRTKQRLAGLAKGFLAFAGISGAVSGILKLTQAASDAQEIMGKFNVVFAENAIAAAKWADDFGEKVGRARQDVKAWMASLQDTFVPLGFTRIKAMELSKELTTLAVDVASFQNAVDKDVMRDFTSALVGNHETVRKYGVIITETALKQEAFSQGLRKRFADLSNLEKVQLRYSLIVRGTSDAHGDAIRTGDSYANRVKRLRANIKNLAETMGEKLLPMMTAIVNKTTVLVRKITINKDAIFNNIVKTLAWTSALLATKAAINIIGSAIKGLVAAYKSLATIKVIVTALTGPAGWLALAASVTIATGVIVGLNEAMNKTASGFKDTIAAAEGIEKITNKVSLTDSKSILEKFAEERRLLAKALEIEAGFGGKESGLRLKMVEDIEKRITALRINYTKARHAEVQQLMRDNVAKQLAERNKLEKAALSELSEFSASLKNRLEDIELGPLAGALVRLERAGKALSGKALDEYNDRLKEARMLVTEIAKKEATVAKIKEISTAKTAFNAGEFRQIRSAFVEVSALGGSSRSPELSRLDKQIEQADQTNAILQDIRDSNRHGVLQ